jgi:hypothetical protein
MGGSSSGSRIPQASWRAFAAVLGLALVGGCDTISQDFNDLTRSLFPPSPSQAAQWALDPHDPDHRREGTLLLANAPFGGNPPYMKMYRDYVANEPNPLVKAVAIRALAKHGTPEDAELIAPHLEDANKQVRWEAAKALQRLHNPAVVPLLLDTLSDEAEDQDVRVAAAIALGQYPEDRVFQVLVEALDARELAVNDAARRSLATLTGESFGLDPRAWLVWYDEHPDDAFAGRVEYLFPTYHRRDNLLETLAFWTDRVEEQPAPPAGLRPSTERRTYEDSEPQPKDEAAEG